MFLLGGAPTAAERASVVLAGCYEGLRASHLCPQLGSGDDDEEMATIAAALEREAPGVVFFAFGTPKEEHVAVRLREPFPGMWFVMAGGTFSMVAGDTPKAPVLLRRMGLEWAHRLRLEPRRLFNRYIVHDLPFALRLFGSVLLVRLRRRKLPGHTAPGQGPAAPRDGTSPR